jgi:signal transduction histidine kinase
MAPDMVVRIYDRGDRLLDQTPRDASAPQVTPAQIREEGSASALDLVSRLAPSIISVHPGPGTFGLATGAHGVRWRLYALPLGQSGHQLTLVASLASLDAAISDFRRLIAFYALAGALVCFTAGWLLAGRALRPVTTLRTTAHGIAHSRDFHRRVPGAAGPDELGQLATTFNDMLGSLEQAYQAQQRFVSDASHELRAPLTAIQANLELLEHQANLSPEDRQAAVHDANSEVHRLSALVADLLALARADAGVPLQHQRVEVDRVLLEAVGAARRLATGPQVRVDTLEPALVEGDPDRLKQLLLVVLDNAVKYTPAGGTVSAALHSTETSARLTIADTGVGIPPDDLPHVFERFYRADPARRRDAGGTGLGLAIAQWIVEQHGGTIAVTSELGTGTTVTIHIPRLR